MASEPKSDTRRGGTHIHAMPCPIHHIPSPQGMGYPSSGSRWTANHIISEHLDRVLAPLRTEIRQTCPIPCQDMPHPPSIISHPRRGWDMILPLDCKSYHMNTPFTMQHIIRERVSTCNGAPASPASPRVLRDRVSDSGAGCVWPTRFDASMIGIRKNRVHSYITDIPS